MTRLACVVTVALAACSDFASIDRGVCGNGIVEPGEDCDSSDPTCVRCAVTCRVATDCPRADYSCGADGTCHAPGGELQGATPPVSFAADDLRITDVDHDGIGDVVGVSKTSLVVRHGDAQGSLQAIDSIVTPAQTGPAAFGDLDGDGSSDVTLSARDGLVTYTSPFGVPSPVDIESPIYSADGVMLDIAHEFPIGALQLGVFFVVQDTVVLAAVDLLTPDASFATPPCSARLGPLRRAQLRTDTIDVYRASPAGAATADIVVSFQTEAGQTCVTAIHGGTLGGYTLTDITPASLAPTHRPILADLDGDGDPCPGIVDSDGGPGALRMWTGDLANGHCTLAASPTALPAIANVPADTVAIGRMPIVPALPGVASDALVMTSGVYAHAPGSSLTAVYTSARRLARVAFGDLDHDGDIDGVLAAEASDDLDVLLRYPLGVELYRLDTESVVTTVTVADFDGNGIDDIGYTERVAGHQRLMIAYDTGDRPLPPTQVATFTGVESVVPLSFPDTEDQLNLATDLAVLQPPVAGSTLGTATMSILHGSPQRTMLSYFDPRRGEQALLRGSVVGAFTGDGHADVLAVGTAASGSVAWQIAGSATGLDATQIMTSAMSALACDGTGVCFDDAMYLAVPGSDHDRVIAIDRTVSPHAALIDPHGLVASAAPALAAAAPPGTAARSLHAVTLAGEAMVVASFASDDASTGAIVACHVDAGAIGTCDDLVEPIRAISEITACIDAAPGIIAGAETVGGTSEPADASVLVVLCRDDSGSSLFRVARDDAGYHASALARGPALTGIRVGDVTGDGVDDVVGVSADQLVVFAQCTTRNLDACRSADAMEMP